MTALVTGASGHVGANLVRHLLARGERVRVLVHRVSSALEGLEVERVSGDVRDPQTLARACSGVTVVYHLAAMISIVGDPQGLVHETNANGALNVARACLEAGVGRLVHCSSVHAFDLRDDGREVNEGTQRVTETGARHNAYDRSKALGEAAVRATIAEGLDAVIVHPTGVLGPHDYGPSRMGQVLLDLYHQRLPAVVDGGFDWVDVRDVSAALHAAAAVGRTNESYLVSGHYHSIAEVAKVASGVTGVASPRLVVPMGLASLAAPVATYWSRLVGREPLFTGESLEALRANPRLDNSKAQRELGLRPRPLTETVRAAYAWFDGQGLLAPKGEARNP